MTLVKYPTQSYKISEASYDVDKEQFFCYVGMPSKDGVNVVKYTIWGEIMTELAPFVGMDYDLLPKRIQKLWEQGQEKCHAKATRFAKKQYEFTQPKQLNKVQIWLNKLFGKSDYGQQ